MLLAWFASIGPVLADTVYVSERAFVDLRTDAHYESPVAHRVEAGSPIETLQQSGDFTQVRDAQGRVGWIETRVLTLDPPARVRQEQLERELETVRSELAQAQAQVAQAHKAMAEDTESEKALLQAQAQFKREAEVLKGRLGQSDADLGRTRAELAQARSALDERGATVSKLESELAAARLALQNALPPPLSAATHPPATEEFAQAADRPGPGKRLLRAVQGLSLGWLALSFAMLLIGFGVGVWWLRERNRKRLGGMYLRV